MPLRFPLDQWIRSISAGLRKEQCSTNKAPQPNVAHTRGGEGEIVDPARCHLDLTVATSWRCLHQQLQVF
jgi:hypothetical protein